MMVLGRIYHVGEVAGEIRVGWMDLGKSWYEAQMFPPTPIGCQGEERNLTGGNLKWSVVGAMDILQSPVVTAPEIFEWG